MAIHALPIFRFLPRSTRLSAWYKRVHKTVKLVIKGNCSEDAVFVPLWVYPCARNPESECAVPRLEGSDFQVLLVLVEQNIRVALVLSVWAWGTGRGQVRQFLSAVPREARYVSSIRVVFADTETLPDGAMRLHASCFHDVAIVTMDSVVCQ
eukprot:11730460-Karenia_brevis.AAC.1